MKIRITIYTLLLVVASTLFASAQAPQGRKYYTLGTVIVDGDTMQLVNYVPVYIFSRPVDLRKYERLVRNVKIVYPIAKDAQAMLGAAESKLLMMSSRKEQKAYIRELEKELKDKYTPILRRMTFSQGKVLIKLIDRQTENTPYELVKELQGGFSAFIWQGVARIFGANLKDIYDKEGEDKIIEQIIMQYEAGLI